MTLRLLNVALAGAFVLATALAVPTSAELSHREQTETLARIRTMKRHMLMQKAQQRILRARVAAKPGKKLPKGFRVAPQRANEGGVTARMRALEDAGKLRTAAGTAANGPTPARMLVGTFGTNKRANNPATDVFADAGQSETSIAGLGNNILLTWNDGNGFDLVAPNYQLLSYGYSTDGGTTWIDGGSLPQPPGSPNWQWSSDPVVTVNETTNEFLFTGLVYPSGPPGTGTTNGVAFVKGTFIGGVFTWGTPVLIASGSNSAFFYDKQWVAVDPVNNNIYLTYTLFTLTGDQIEFRRSINGGALWTNAVTLSASGDNGFVQGSRVAVGPGSEVYTVWQVIGDIDKDYFRMKKSTNLGVTFGSEVQPADYFANFSSGAPGFNRERGITYPGLAVDRTNGPSRGRVYVSWNECINYYADLLLAPGPGKTSEPEPGAAVVNNSFATATPFILGNTVRGTISDNAVDLDFYSFTATQGQTCVFFVDSLSVGLDMAFRLFCSDQNTRLAISSPGKGFENLIIWTAPATGTYYIRPAAWTDTSDPAPHEYRIRTRVHSNPGSDRARDHRDIYVASSSNGLTWPLSGAGSPVRVNDDSPWFDNWLPEVAVTGHSRVFSTWFDWRDSAPSTCGGQSNLYLYRSDNAGAAWSNLGMLTDATTSWTSVASNVAPNQGDYVALFANYTGVYPAWGDGRDGNPNVYTVAIPIATPTLASLAGSRVEAGRVELDWLAGEYLNQPVKLERRDAETAWSVVGADVIDGTGRVRFVDTGVAAGRRYTYRLAFDSGTSYSSETEIAVPAGPTLELAAPQPNPASRDLWLSFSLPGSAAASLSLVDIAGRVVQSREVGELGAGRHRVNLAEGVQLAPGVYVVVLRQGGRVLTRRVSVVP
ncbi:MAG: T9SS type A sorting domain-containing protein [Candidatus Eisenbacteria bacterium]